MSGPSRYFVFDRDLSNPVSDYTKYTTFDLYDNGAFLLYLPDTIWDHGRYEDANGVIAFEFPGSDGAGRATGTLKGDSLTVQYNEFMRLRDYEDAVYVRIP